MLKSELIELLQEIPEDLPVRLITDHGHELMSPGSVYTTLVEDNEEYMAQEVDVQDDEYEGHGEDVIVVGAF